MLELVVIVVFALLGVITQRIVGFGIASFLVPVLLIYFNAPISVTVTLFVATTSCLVLLYNDRKSSQLHWPIISRLFIAAIPGLLLGSYIVTRIDRAVLQIIIGILIIVSTIVQEYAFPKPTTPLRVSRGINISGFMAGLLNACAAQAPAPLVLWMRSHIATPNQIRHNLAATFIFMNITSITVIHLLKPSSLDSKGIMIFGLLVPVIVVGNFFGKILANKINPAQYRKIVLVTIIVAGTVSIALGVANLR